MSGLEFVARIVSSIAWPLVILALGLAFRKVISRALSGRVSRVKATAGGLELEFYDERVEHVASEIRAIEEAQARAASTSEDSVVPDGAPEVSVNESDAHTEALDEISALLEVSPRAAALEAYALMEEELRSLAVQVGLLDAREARRSLRYLAGISLQAGLISNRMAHSMYELTALRNLLAHRGTSDNPEFGLKRAREFISLAMELRNVIAHIPRSEAFEASLARSFERIGLQVARVTGPDRGFDMLVGSERRIGVAVKLSKRPLAWESVRRHLESPIDRPLLFVSSVTLTAAALQQVEDFIAKGHSVRFVRWSGPSDDGALASAVTDLISE